MSTAAAGAEQGEPAPRSTLGQRALDAWDRPLGIALTRLVLLLVLVLGAWRVWVLAATVGPGAAPGWWYPAWWWAVAFLVAAFALVGHLMHKRLLGFLITDNHVMSASRAQAAIWTVTIASTYVVTVLVSLARGNPVPELGEGVLLTTMAASGSLVGAQLLNVGKANTPAKPEDVSRVVAKGAEAQGLLWRNRDAKDARVKDVFEGDELADGEALDAGKAQMLVLTLLLALVYLLQFFHALDAASRGEAQAIVVPPDVPLGTVGLLSVSHGAYLGNKLPRRTPAL
ncbi:MAG: hypothetical protein QOE90_1161 [Thermoplasmata archaeon]|jgi:hypothetical protein|nr:hypothetical protein [Thermoplasmata archaeon]